MKEKKSSENIVREAVVVKNSGSHFLLSELPKWEMIPAVLRGKIRLKDNVTTNPVAVGDKVLYEYDPKLSLEQNPAVIKEVLPRENYLIRKSTNLSKQAHVIAANIDHAFIIVSLLFPEIKLPFLDRVLVTCEIYNLPVTIILNKVDLYKDLCPEELDNFHRIYEGAGYKVIETSTITGEGIDELRAICHEGVNLFSGESGVGKSSLIKAVDPTLEPKIGDISIVHLQGKHTTSMYQMYDIDGGGYIIDTPGIRGFGLVDVEKEEIGLYFPEMFKFADDCKFAPCTHTHEPGCAVKQAVEEGLISQERYSSYLGMLQEDQKFR